ncbi:MAG: hypothetical protein COA79_03220 [Planctomycetota bacterium]|nr:MAG: hypothetical protein COA79_03220 [Planctomycetota bacterium]
MLKRFSEVKNRFLLIGLLAIGLVAVLFSVTMYFVNNSLAEELVEKYLETESVQLLNLRIEVENTLFELKTDDSSLDKQKQEILKGLSDHVTKQEAVYAVVLSSNGETVEYTHPGKKDEIKPIELSSDIFSPEKIKNKSMTPVINHFIDQKTSQKIYQISIPIIKNGEVNGMIKVLVSRKDIIKRMKPLLFHIRKVLTIAGVVGGALVLFVGIILFYLLLSSRSLQIRLDNEKHIAAVGTIASGMAHEIKNPLNALGMSLQMLQNKVGEDKDHISEDDKKYLKEKLSFAMNESQRLEGILNNYLNQSHSKEKYEMISISNTISDSAELLRSEAEFKKLQLNFIFTKDFEINAPPLKLKQVFINVLLNGIQNTESGSVTIKLLDTVNDGFIQIEVEDSGLGIPIENQDKIFQLFYTTRNSGTGMGLHVVSTILDEIHGKIKLTSSSSNGSVFKIELPLNSNKIN